MSCKFKEKCPLYCTKSECNPDSCMEDLMEVYKRDHNELNMLKAKMEGKYIDFDDYLHDILPKDISVEHVVAALMCKTPIYITGNERTGKTTLKKVLCRHGGCAMEEANLLHIHLTKQIPFDEMIPNLYQDIQ